MLGERDVWYVGLKTELNYALIAAIVLFAFWFRCDESFFLGTLYFLMLSVVGKSSGIVPPSSAIARRTDDIRLIMHIIRSVFTLNLVTPELFFRLGTAKQIGSKFSGTHMVEDVLTLFELLPPVDRFRCQTVVETAIAVILKDYEV